EGDGSDDPTSPEDGRRVVLGARHLGDQRRADERPQLGDRVHRCSPGAVRVTRRGPQTRTAARVRGRAETTPRPTTRTAATTAAHPTRSLAGSPEKRPTATQATPHVA